MIKPYNLKNYMNAQNALQKAKFKAEAELKIFDGLKPLTHTINTVDDIISMLADASLQLDHGGVTKRERAGCMIYIYSKAAQYKGKFSGCSSITSVTIARCNGDGKTFTITDHRHMASWAAGGISIKLPADAHAAWMQRAERRYDKLA